MGQTAGRLLELLTLLWAGLSGEYGPKVRCIKSSAASYADEELVEKGLLY